jgi:protein ImuB
VIWLALHLPALSLEAFAATLAPAERAAPLALAAQHQITAVNAAAAACGVRPGLKRATALALAADLRLGQADPARDAAALGAVAHAALAFTPDVSLDGDATVLLEVSRVLRYHGGPERLHQRLLQRLLDALAPLGHQVQMASAPTPLGAALLARWPPAERPAAVPAAPSAVPSAAPSAAPSSDRPRGPLDFTWGLHSHDLPALQALLDTAPVWLLGPGRAHWEALQGMGLHQWSDLRTLPRSGLTRRFGATLLADLDRARGDAPDPREPLRPPPVFDDRLELYARADTTEQVLHGAQVLLARLIAWAQARQSRIAGFSLRMRHEALRRNDGPAHTDLAVDLAEPAADAAQLGLLLRERLAQCPLPAPTLELQLHCHRLVQAPPPSGDLFPSRQAQREGLGRLLERLRARLGDTQVQRLLARPDHRPEHATGLQGWMAARPAHPGASGADPTPPTLPLHRPAWLLPEPQALPERGALPLLDGRPLQIVSGPERIEAGWWDQDLAARDYFIARADDGALVWIYRTRLPLDSASGWYLQGRFG